MEEAIRPLTSVRTTRLPRRALDKYNGEVVAALREIGNPRYGANIASDRGSSMEYLGIRFPALRRRVNEGFSFYDLSGDEILAIWDRLWCASPSSAP